MEENENRIKGDLIASTTNSPIPTRQAYTPNEKLKIDLSDTKSINQNTTGASPEYSGRRSSRTPKRNTLYEESHIPNVALEETVDASLDDFDDFDEINEVGDIEEGESGHIRNFPVLRTYFYERLLETIISLGGKTARLSTWKVDVVLRSGGLSQGIIDVYYYNPRGKKFRSRVETAVCMGLLPVIGQLKNMTRDQHYLVAVEMREKFLISQIVGALKGAHYDKVTYTDDHIVFLRAIDNPGESSIVASMPTSSSVPASMSPVDEDSAENVATHLPSSQQMTSPVSNGTPADQSPLPIDEAFLSLATPTLSNNAPEGTFEPIVREYFAAGNITVLNWGCIRTDALFHTGHQLFPVGFRCIRQEMDLVVDRPVDCLCEIDVTQQVVDGQVVERPLFRISVEWQVPTHTLPPKPDSVPEPTAATESNAPAPTVNDMEDEQEHEESALVAPVAEETSPSQAVPALLPDLPPAFTKVVKVYESHTPQNVWQAVLLETIGLQNDAFSVGNSASDSIIPDGTASPETDAEIESMDEEEKALRDSVQEERKNYFRVLRQKQVLGLHAAIKPRLSIDDAHMFNVDSIARLLEGMKGVRECEKYRFLGSREKDGGRKGTFEGLLRMVVHAKEMEKTILRGINSRRSTSSGKRKGKLLFKQAKKLKSEPNTSSISQFALEIGDELGTDIVYEDVDTLKDSRILKPGTAAGPSRAQIRAKIRDVDKTVKTIKENMFKALRRRKEEAKLRLDILCDQEETGIVTDYTIDPISGTRSAGCQPQLQSLKSNATITTTYPSISEEEKRSNMPVGFAVPLDNTLFVQTLELYHMLQTYASPLQLQTQPPSFQELIGFLQQCDRRLSTLADYSVRTDNKPFDILSPPCDNSVSDSATVDNDAVVEPSFSTYVNVFERIAVQLCRFLMPEFIRVSGMDPNTDPVDLFPLNALTWCEIFRTVLLSHMYKEVGLTDSDITATLRGKPFAQYVDASDRFLLRLCRCRILFDHSIRNEDHETITGFDSGVSIRCPAPGPYNGQYASLVCLLKTLASVADHDAWLVREIIERCISWCQNYSDSNASLQLLSRLKMLLRPPILRPSDASLSKAYALQLLSHIDLKDVDQTKDAEIFSNLLTRFYNCSEPALTDLSVAPMTVFSLRHRQALCMSQCHAETEKLVMTMDIALEEDDNDALPFESIPVENDDNEAVDEAILVDGAAEAPDTANLFEFNDIEEVMSRSVATQRCYMVLNELMQHSYAAPFCFPVDPVTAPIYPAVIAQPVALADIRKHLVKGMYECQLYQFYSDVMLVFDNACIFNLDHTATCKQAQKLQTVFERLFLETVLEWDAPIENYNHCHACNNTSKQTATESITCERCGGGYHTACLTPSEKSLVPPMGREWICPACVERRGVASVHHFKLAHVRHPHRPGMEGEVVAIEQRRQTLVFIIEFGSSREVWTGRKLREHVIETDENGESTLPIFPSGYDADDYDNVCGIARGYGGWTTSHFLEPLNLSDSHYLSAKSRSRSDLYFQLNRSVVSLLGSGAEAQSFSAEEWVAVLRSLLHKVLSISPNTQINGRLDSEAEAYTITTCPPELLSSVANPSSILQVSSSKPDATEVSSSVKDEMKIDSDTAAPSSKRSSSTTDKFLLGEAAKEVPVLSAPATTIVDDNSSPVTTVKDEFELNMPSDYNSSADPGDTQKQSSDDITDMHDNNFNDNDEAVSESEQEFAWEYRKLSRRKAREEALLATDIFRDVLKEMLSDDNLCDSEYVTGFSASVMRSLCRELADADLDHDEWDKAWMAQFSVMDRIIDWNSTGASVITSDANIDMDKSQLPTDSSFQPIATNTSPLATVRQPIRNLCQFCGFDEAQLGSIFVCGQTLSEWNEERLENVSIDASNKFKTDTSRLRIWVPVDAHAAEVELTECGRCENEPRLTHSGSLVVHEACAEIMAAGRTLAVERSERTHNQRLLDIIIGHTRAKSTPLGEDASGNLYWYFADFPSYLFMCVPHGNPEGQFKALMDGSIERDTVFSDVNKFTTDPFRRATATWSIYQSTQQISQIASLLNRRHPQESFLLKALAVVYSVSIGKAEVITDSSHSNSESNDPLHGLCDDAKLVISTSDKFKSSSVSTNVAIKKPKQDISAASEAIASAAAVTKAKSKPKPKVIAADDDDEWNEGDEDVKIKYNDGGGGNAITKRTSSDAMDIDEEFNDGEDEEEEEEEEESEADDNVEDFTTRDDFGFAQTFISRNCSRRGRYSQPRPLRNSDSIADRLASSGWTADMIVGADVVTQSEGSNVHWTGTVSAIVAAPQQSGKKASKSNSTSFLCRVNYNGWGEEYSNWVNASRVYVNADGDDVRMSKLLHQHCRELKETLPEELRSLQAFTYVNNSGRSIARNPASYSILLGAHTYSSSCRGTPALLLVKKAMLLVEAALPIGALDKSDEKWGRKQFAQAWREAIASAADATSLMQCQLLLEFSIKQQWVRPNNIKVFGFLPSRAFSLRNATIGMVAMRIWALDHTIKYDKVEKEAGRKAAVSYALSTTSAGATISKSKSEEFVVEEADANDDSEGFRGQNRKERRKSKPLL